MTRIAIVTDWFAPRRGGIEAQLGELAARLARGGEEVAVVTATPGEAADRPYRIHRLDVPTLPSPPLAVSPRTFSALRREFAKGYDVVHAHVSVVSPVGWAAAIVARSLGIPTVVTFHSVLRVKALVLRMAAAVAPLAEARIAWSAVSRVVAGQARWALGGTADVSVLPNGADIGWWRSGGDVGTRRESPVFISTMRLHRKKRGRALVRAFADAARGSHARLLLVGDGPERATIQGDIDALGLGSGAARVELPGWQQPTELRALYRSADAFVLPSVHESFGIAALEASAAGLPVIARRSGVTEFLTHGENAILADSDEELVAAMRSFVSAAGSTSTPRANPEALMAYDWSRVIPAHLAEYERAIRLAASPARAGAGSA